MASPRSGAATDEAPAATSMQSSMEALRAEAAAFLADPFLLTVTADGEPHCSPVPVEWTADQLIVPAPRHWAQSPPPPAGPSPARTPAARPVSLLFAPNSPSGYALIVNGTTGDSGPRLTVSVTRAVLHRRGNPTGADGTTCGSDCVPLFPSV